MIESLFFVLAMLLVLIRSNHRIARQQLHQQGGFKTITLSTARQICSNYLFGNYWRILEADLQMMWFTYRMEEVVDLMAFYPWKCAFEKLCTINHTKIQDKIVLKINLKKSKNKVGLEGMQYFPVETESTRLKTGWFYILCDRPGHLFALDDNFWLSLLKSHDPFQKTIYATEYWTHAGLCWFFWDYFNH